MRARRALNAYRAQRNTRVEYLLQHLLWCRESGLRFTGRTQRYSYSRPTKDGRRVRYDRPRPRRDYACVASVEYAHTYACRKPVHLHADLVEAAVWGRLAEALRRPEILLRGVRERLAALEAEAAGTGGGGGAVSIGEAGRQLAQLQQQKLEIARQRIRGGIDDPTLDTLQGEVEAQTAYWQERFDAEQHLRADVEAQRRALRDAAAHLRRLSDHVARRLEQLTFAERRALLEALVDRIWVDGRNRITIEGVLDGAVPAFVLSPGDPGLRPSRPSRYPRCASW